MRILIGEDEVLLQEGLRTVLGGDEFEVVGIAGDGLSLVRLAAELAPELLITDIRMPPSNADEGLRAALVIQGNRPDLPIVVLSQHLQRQYVAELLDSPSAGVGYLLKQRIANVAAFREQLRRVVAGETVLDPEVVSLLMSRAAVQDEGLGRLSPRQQEVLTLMAEGRSNAAIARQLFISEKAVVQHASHIYRELGLEVSDDEHRRVLAVLRYLAG